MFSHLKIFVCLVIDGGYGLTNFCPLTHFLCLYNVSTLVVIAAVKINLLMALYMFFVCISILGCSILVYLPCSPVKDLIHPPFCYSAALSIFWVKVYSAIHLPGKSNLFEARSHLQVQGSCFQAWTSLYMLMN